MTKKRKRQRPSRQIPQSPHAPSSEAVVEAEGLVVAELPPPEQALSLIQRLTELRETPLLAFVVRPDVVIRGDVVEQIYEQLRQIGRVPRLDLFLHSSGGQTEVPWRLITLIRDFAERFSVLIPGIAHSAATHLAMGADEIVMGPLSELSPVDPSRTHPLLPSRKEGEPPLAISVQDLRHCVKFVGDEIGISTPDTWATVICALFDKVHPLAIGAIQRSYALARLISTKALSTHMDPVEDKEQIDRIVNTFSEEFFSHHYFIGRKEARETGLNVADASEELWEAMWALYKHYKPYFSAARPIGENQAARPVVWIDSIHQRWVLEEVLSTTPDKVTEGFRVERTESRWLEVPWQTVDQVEAEE